MLIALDVETTGLDPHNDYLLEIAACGLWPDGTARDDVPAFHSFVNSFGSRAMFDAVIDSMHDIPKQMHASNGLVRDIHKFWGGVPSREQVDKSLEQWLASLGCGTRTGMLVGYSVHFDHLFMRVHTPIAFKRLSHRVLDLSTLRFCTQEWSATNPPPNGVTHRATDDVAEVVRHFAHYRDLIART
jgi:oligoribonuclease